MINRRTFIGGVALVAIAPLSETQALPSPLPDARARRTILVIEGWSTPASDDITDQVSIRIGAGWRTSWR